MTLEPISYDHHISYRVA